MAGGIGARLGGMADLQVGSKWNSWDLEQSADDLESILESWLS